MVGVLVRRVILDCVSDLGVVREDVSGRESMYSCRIIIKTI